MSQYNRSMFSDAVYLFGTTLSSPSRGGYFEFKEELPDGRMVDQKELAEQAVLAAFAYLYNKKLIDIVRVERTSLFETAIVKKLQSSPLDTSGPLAGGLELVIFSSIRDNSNIYDITKRLMPGRWNTYSNPWGEVLKIVKENLLDRRILKQVEKRKVLFITTYKYVVNGDISNEEKQATELKKTLAELQSKGELYERILSAIKDGISSRRLSPAGA